MPGANLGSDVWMAEYMTPYDVYFHAIKYLYCYKRTKYQELHIVDSGPFGKALILDGKWQSCTSDEFMYHEPLVHVPCLYHGSPEKVLILGAGEGAAAREALKWKTVKKVAMIDIDEEVVEACKEHLPEMHQGSFDDPRTELIIGDALELLDQYENEWDVIISDLSDQIEEGPSFKLFTKEYFAKCRRALSPDGYFVVQAGPTAPALMAMHVRLVKTVGAVFKHATSYSSHVASYSSPWGYVLGSDRPINRNLNPAEAQATLDAKTAGELKMLDGNILFAIMQVPRFLREAIEKEQDVYTVSEPPKFFGKGITGTGAP